MVTSQVLKVCLRVLDTTHLLTCALLPESGTGPPLLPQWVEKVRSEDNLVLHFPLVRVCGCPLTVIRKDRLGSMIICGKVSNQNISQTTSHLIIKTYAGFVHLKIEICCANKLTGVK